MTSLGATTLACVTAARWSSPSKRSTSKPIVVRTQQRKPTDHDTDDATTGRREERGQRGSPGVAGQDEPFGVHSIGNRVQVTDLHLGRVAAQILRFPRTPNTIIRFHDRHLPRLVAHHLEALRQGGQQVVILGTTTNRKDQGRPLACSLIPQAEPITGSYDRHVYPRPHHRQPRPYPLRMPRGGVGVRPDRPGNAMAGIPTHGIRKVSLTRIRILRSDTPCGPQVSQPAFRRVQLDRTLRF